MADDLSRLWPPTRPLRALLAVLLGMTTPVVPRSLTKPVPASQARSQIQEQIDANRERVERLNAATKRRLVRRLVALEGELRERLDQLQREGRGDTWTASDTEATLLQVRELLGSQGRAFRELLAANGARARELGGKSAVDVLRHFEGKAGAPIRPLAIGAAVAAQDPLLGRYEVSVARWGQRTIGRIAEQLQRGLLVGETFDQMKRRLTGERGGGVLVQSAGDAARIIRTEGMSSYAQGTQEEIVAQKAKRFPDLMRRLIETFDARTAADSRVAHGEVRDVNEPFTDGKHTYLTPPGRPNDRAVIIPWRKEWEGEQATKTPYGEERKSSNDSVDEVDYMAVRSPLLEPVPTGSGGINLKPQPIGGNVATTASPVMGQHFRGPLISAIDPVKTEEVLRILGEAGLLPFLAQNSLGQIEIGARTWIRFDPLDPNRVVSWHNGAHVGGNLQINAGKRVAVLPGVSALGQGWDPQPPKSKDPPQDNSTAPKPHLRPDTFSSTAGSRVEAGRRVLIHEVGHHIIHVGNFGLRDIGDAATIIEKAFGNSDKNPLTQYCDDNAHEYFCECFAIYVYDRGNLKKNDPVGFRMVEDVLRLKQIGLLP